MFKRKKTVASIVIMLTVLVCVSAIPQTKANPKFVIASQYWAYPDQYGQGIEYLYIVMDIDDTPYNWTYQYYNNTESTGLDVLANSTMNLRARVWLNGTFTGYTYEQGRDLYTRVGVVVTDQDGTTCFSEENITQAGGSSALDPMWRYDYEVEIDLGFQSGFIYTVTIIYDIYY